MSSKILIQTFYFHRSCRDSSSLPTHNLRVGKLINCCILAYVTIFPCRNYAESTVGLMIIRTHHQASLAEVLRLSEYFLICSKITKSHTNSGGSCYLSLIHWDTDPDVKTLHDVFVSVHSSSLLYLPCITHLGSPTHVRNPKTKSFFSVLKGSC